MEKEKSKFENDHWMLNKIPFEYFRDSEAISWLRARLGWSLFPDTWPAEIFYLAKFRSWYSAIITHRDQYYDCSACLFEAELPLERLGLRDMSARRLVWHKGIEVCNIPTSTQRIRRAWPSTEWSERVTNHIWEGGFSIDGTSSWDQDFKLAWNAFSAHCDWWPERANWLPFVLACVSKCKIVLNVGIVRSQFNREVGNSVCFNCRRLGQTIRGSKSRNFGRSMISTVVFIGFLLPYFVMSLWTHSLRRGSQCHLMVGFWACHWLMNDVSDSTNYLCSNRRGLA